MLVSYHVHSNLSDGKYPIRDIVRAGVDQGLDELGISDHYVLLPSDRIVDWSMPPSGLPAYIDEIRAAAEEASAKMTVRFGIEADFIPDTIEDLRGMLAEFPFDYVIGSVHYVDGFLVDADPKHWERISEAERNDVIRGYWSRIADMAATRLFDFVGHLDLCKKFGYAPSIDVSDDIVAALDALARSRMAVEVNTAGWHVPAREVYPSPMILKSCFRRGIPALVTADAHDVAFLTRDFDRGKQLLRSVGYTETAVYAGRQRAMIPL
ncbi:MAG: histidinol-phosphatase HisJ family protein [Armatimonadetes bacterium]|nr:histidinol-phosphatase HisJ family protein [Armatimonadota bacterium]